MKRWFASRMMVYIYICTGVSLWLTLRFDDPELFGRIALAGIAFGQMKNMLDRHVEARKPYEGD